MSCKKTHFDTATKAETRMAAILASPREGQLYLPTGVIRCRCGKGYVLTSKSAKPWASGKTNRRHQRR